MSGHHQRRAAAGGVVPLEITYINSTGTDSGATEYTFSSLDFGVADANRYIIAFCGGVSGGGDEYCTVTIGGVTATKVVEHDGTSQSRIWAGWCMAAVPTGTTGDIVVTSQNGSLNRCAAHWYRIIGPPELTAFATDLGYGTDGSLSFSADNPGIALAGWGERGGGSVGALSGTGWVSNKTYTESNGLKSRVAIKDPTAGGTETPSQSISNGFSGGVSFSA